MFYSLYNLNEWPDILRVNLLLSLVFIGIAVFFISLILYLRLVKNWKETHKKNLENKLLDFISNYLFDENLNKDFVLGDFKFQYLRTDFDKKIALKQLLVFHENLKGESSQAIKELFLGFGLSSFLHKELRKKAWYTKARALYALSKFGYEAPKHLVAPCLDSKHVELREQAMFYYLNTTKKDSLSFLDQVDTTLTLWQQVFIENALNNLDITIPDFSRWLKHKESSVVIFSVKMIVNFNQFQNIPTLIAFLDHPLESVRNQVIQALKTMEVVDALPTMLENFPNETRGIKQEILYALKEMGSVNELENLIPHIASEDENLQIDFFKISKKFKAETPVHRLPQFTDLKENWSLFQETSLKLYTGS